MFRCIPIQPCQNRCRTILLSLQYVLTGVFALAILLSQAVPMQAAHSGDGWIEICGGDEGSYFIQIGEDTGSGNRDCAHCDYCLTPGSSAVAHFPNFSGINFTLKFVDLSLPDFDETPAPNPAQYWPANRGPPIESNISTMTNHNSYDIYLHFGSDIDSSLNNRGLLWS